MIRHTFDKVEDSWFIVLLKLMYLKTCRKTIQLVNYRKKDNFKSEKIYSNITNLVVIEMALFHGNH